MFLIENSEFVATNPDIKNLALARGVSIIKQRSRCTVDYRLSSIPMKHGLRYSSIPQVRYPAAVVNFHGAQLPVWSTVWDTSLVAHCLARPLNPLIAFCLTESAIVV